MSVGATGPAGKQGPQGVPGKVTIWIAALALFVGSLSAIGGVLQEHAADRKVCDTQTATNAAVRGLLSDFIKTNPKVTKAQAIQAQAIAQSRFPVKPC
jgi:hypothetical protein